MEQSHISSCTFSFDLLDLFFFNEALFDFCCLISFVSFSPFYLILFHFRFYFLLGSGCSGKTTFLKQLRILYGDGYTEKERKEFKPVIYGNVRRAMIRILEAMEEIGLTFTNEELSTKVIQCCGRQHKREGFLVALSGKRRQVRGEYKERAKHARRNANFIMTPFAWKCK